MNIQENWEFIDEQIERSRIIRFPWKKILGMSLTKYILKLMNKEVDSKEAYKIILRNPNIIKVFQKNPKLVDKMKENIKISVSARYGENNTSKNIREEK